jgi:hypothetical protein
MSSDTIHPGYVGADRRMDPSEEEKTPLSIVITGSKLPMLALLVAIGAFLSALIYTTVWLTKVDDRTQTNALTNKQHATVLAEHTRVLVDVQRSAAVTAAILERILGDHEDLAKAISTDAQNTQNWSNRITRLETKLELMMRKSRGGTGVLE